MSKLKSVILVAVLLLSSFALLVPASAVAEAEPMDMHPMGTSRVVLFEQFTAGGCGFCPPVSQALVMMEDDYERDECVILSYHGSLGNDPLNHASTVPRLQNYGFTGYPSVAVDGALLKSGGGGTAQQQYQALQGLYNQRTGISSDLKMSVEGDMDTDLEEGDIWVNITALDPPSEDNLRLHVVVFENDIDYNAPNGETIHNFVVREMLDGTSGKSISITQGQTLSYFYSFDFPTYQDATEIGVLAFVQTSDRTLVPGSNPARYTAPVLQACYINVIQIPNVIPQIKDGFVDVPDGATEDDTITFKTWYRDIDDFKNDGPADINVIYKNGTTGTPIKADMDPIPGQPPWTDGKWVQYQTKLAPGTYYYKFNATDGEDFALGDTDWNMTGFTILMRNKIPQLRELYPTYDPMVGDTDTTFRFQVQYRDLDGEEPAIKNIVLNDVEYSMTTDAQNNWASWQTFYYETQLPVGTNHRFYFTFTDGEDSVRYPKVTASPNRLLGPDVEKPNTLPVLSASLFSPNEGTRLDTFTFTVMYTDGDNDHPTISYIYLDGTPAIMDSGGDTSYSLGVTYSYSTSLNLGPHTISFMFKDGKDEVRYPAAGTIDGPMVNNMNPAAIIANPVDERRYTPEEYVPFSAQGSDDPEGDEMFFKWTSSIDGTLNTLSAFDTTLNEGEHLITLEVTDSEGGVGIATITITVEAMRAHPYIMGIDVNNNDPIEGDMITFTAKITNDGESGATGLPVRWLVDGVVAKEDVTSVDINAERTVTFSWTSTNGDHTIRLEITGAKEEFSVSVGMNALPVSVPEIVNPSEDGSYKVGEEIYFKAIASDINGDGLEYSWNFGDGTPPVTQENPSHIFAEPGDYVVTVTITDSRGGATEESFTVTIKDARKADESPGFGTMMAATAVIAAMAAMAVRRRRE